MKTEVVAAVHWNCTIPGLGCTHYFKRNSNMADYIYVVSVSGEFMMTVKGRHTAVCVEKQPSRLNAAKALVTLPDSCACCSAPVGAHFIFFSFDS